MFELMAGIITPLLIVTLHHKVEMWRINCRFKKEWEAIDG